MGTGSKTPPADEGLWEPLASFRGLPGRHLGELLSKGRPGEGEGAGGVKPGTEKRRHDALLEGAECGSSCGWDGCRADEDTVSCSPGEAPPEFVGDS